MFFYKLYTVLLRVYNVLHLPINKRNNLKQIIINSYSEVCLLSKSVFTRDDVSGPAHIDPPQIANYSNPSILTKLVARPDLQCM